MICRARWRSCAAVIWASRSSLKTSAIKRDWLSFPKIEAEEQNFDFTILDRVIEEATNVDIRTIAEQTEEEVVEVETVALLSENDVVLDIRSIDEQEEKPLTLNATEVKSLPFYKLSTQFGDLDQNRTWLLYCDRGVMSRLQALYLHEQGFKNVKVYRP